MTSFVKHIAVLVAALIATTALAEKSGDNKASTPDPKASGKKEPKKAKTAKKSDDQSTSKGAIDVPVVPGHPSKGLVIPYFVEGKRQMNFTIGVASRLDGTHIEMTDMQVQTFNEEEQREMQIDLPTSILDTEKSMLTTNTHATIRRADFELTGETMVFYTKTKQGGLGGNVRMLIYNLDEETSDAAKPGESKDTPKTPESKEKPNTPESKEK